MGMVSPAQAAQAWVNGMQAAGAKITAGVNAVTVSPTSAAADASDRMLMGITRAVQSGKWQNSLRAVSLQDWKSAMLEKGVNRIGGGAAAAKGKMQAFLGQFLPYLAAGVQQMNAQHPRGDLEANIARMGFLARYNAQFKKT
jgi:hypothetical protein